MNTKPTISRYKNRKPIGSTYKKQNVLNSHSIKVEITMTKDFLKPNTQVKIDLI